LASIASFGGARSDGRKRRRAWFRRVARPRLAGDHEGWDRGDARKRLPAGHD
jgi:hypothetical protein